MWWLVLFSLILIFGCWVRKLGRCGIIRCWVRLLDMFICSWFVSWLVLWWNMFCSFLMLLSRLWVCCWNWVLLVVSWIWCVVWCSNCILILVFSCWIVSDIEVLGRLSVLVVLVNEFSLVICRKLWSWLR